VAVDFDVPIDNLATTCCDMDISHSIEIKSWTPELDPSLRNIHVTAGGRQVIDRHIESLGFDFNGVRPSFDVDSDSHSHFAL
jgi:hypothetical protein